MSSLQAWCNSYECVAATSKEEAESIVRAMGTYEEEDIEGEGWKVLPDDKVICEEDGKPTTETVGMAVAALGKPGPLWSCVQ